SMALKWFRRKDGTTKSVMMSSGVQESTNMKSVAFDSEDSAQSIVKARNMNSWLDDAFREFEQNGGLEHLENKGKPIQIQNGDPLNSILKNANYLPPWLELQHQIQKQILQLIERMDHGLVDISEELTIINKQIAKYNQSVPTPILQKGRISEEHIREQIQLWL